MRLGRKRCCCFSSSSSSCLPSFYSIDEDIQGIIGNASIIEFVIILQNVRRNSEVSVNELLMIEYHWTDLNASSDAIIGSI